MVKLRIGEQLGADCDERGGELGHAAPLLAVDSNGATASAFLAAWRSRSETQSDSETRPLVQISIARRCGGVGVLRPASQSSIVGPDTPTALAAPRFEIASETRKARSFFTPSVSVTRQVIAIDSGSVNPFLW